MPWWNERRILFWFVPVVLLLLVNGFIAYRSVQTVLTNTERERRIQEVLLELEGVISALKDAETGQRGYLLTGEAVYLDPYLQSVDTVGRRIERLTTLLAENPAQQQRLVSLRDLTNSKIAELRQTIMLRQTEGLPAALEVVRSDSGKRIMDQIRDLISTMQQEEQRQLDQRLAASGGSAQTALGNLALASLVSLLLLLAIGIISYRDLLARQRAAEELHRQRERFEVTLASIGDAVIATDTDGTITFMNHPAEELTGWHRNEAVGRSSAEVFHIINEQTRQPVESPIEEVLRRNTIVGLANHTILIARDGTEHAIDDSGAPIRDSSGAVIGVVLVFRDVSSRRRIERDQELVVRFNDALAGSLEQPAILDALVHQLVPLVADICFVDLVLEDGTLQRTTLVYNLRPDQAHIQEVLDRHNPFDNEYRSSRVFTQGRPLLVANVTDDILVRLSRGEEHLAILRSLGIRSSLVVPLEARGQMLGALTLVGLHPRLAFTQHDLTLAVELGRRAALALDNGRLYKLAQDAVRDREQFLSIAAHELRTPLTALLGRAELLQRRARPGQPLGDRDLRSVEVLVDQSVRLNRMITTMLDLSRIQFGHFTLDVVPLDLATLVRRLIDEFQPASEHHTVTYEEHDLSLTILGDPLRLEQVVVNLLQNAVKYSPNGGTIHVALARRDGSATLSVSDEGIGIPASALPNLFSRFYRAPNATDNGGINGMGIGLYVVKEIIDLHGGTVAVASSEGAGSTFTITLPLASASS